MRSLCFINVEFKETYHTKSTFFVLLTILQHRCLIKKTLSQIIHTGKVILLTLLISSSTAEMIRSVFSGVCCILSKTWHFPLHVKVHICPSWCLWLFAVYVFPIAAFRGRPRPFENPGRPSLSLHTVFSIHGHYFTAQTVNYHLWGTKKNVYKPKCKIICLLSIYQCFTNVLPLYTLSGYICLSTFSLWIT